MWPTPTVLRRLWNLVPNRLAPTLVSKTGVYRIPRFCPLRSLAFTPLFAQSAHSLIPNDVCYIFGTDPKLLCHIGGATVSTPAMKRLCRPGGEDALDIIGYVDSAKPRMLDRTC